MKQVLKFLKLRASRFFQIFLLFLLFLLLLNSIFNNSFFYANAAETKTYTDSLQRKVEIQFPPKRIISIAPSITEMLFAINLDSEIVGVTDFCDYPPKAKQKLKIGSYYIPSIEKIIELKPDLLITAKEGFKQGLIEKLSSLGVPCFVIDPQSIDKVLEDMLILGEITGKGEEAKKAVEKLRDRVEDVRKKVESTPSDKRLKVFYQLSHDPLWTAGPGNHIDDLIKTAGGINIASDSRLKWTQYSLEALIAKKPDLILIGKSDSQKVENLIAPWQKYDVLPAVVQKKIYTIDSAWVDRPGPRIVDALEKLFMMLYGDEKSK